MNPSLSNFKDTYVLSSFEYHRHNGVRIGSWLYAIRILTIFILTVVLLTSTSFANTITSISLGQQTGSLQYGTPGSVTYAISFVTSGSGGGNSDITINWTPSPGLTSSLANGITLDLSTASSPILLTIYSNGTVPVGSTSFTVSSSHAALTTNTETVVVTKAPLTITANNLAKTYGQVITPIGNEFVATGLKNGETIGLVGLSSSGFASNATVSGSPYSIAPSGATAGTFNAGNYDITYINGSLTLSKASTSIDVTSTLPTACETSSITFNAAITSSPTTTTGTVQFYDNGNPLGGPVSVSSNAASYTTSGLTPGSHSITAAYSGDDNFNSSTTATPVSQVVVSSTTTASAGPDQTSSATCGLTSVTLAANTPTYGTGSWSIVAGIGGSINNPSSPTSTFSGVPGNSYTLRWTISNAPCAATSDDVVITFNQVATILDKTATICSDGTFTITPATGSGDIVPTGTSYSWSVPVVTGGLTGGSTGSNATTISGTLTNPTNQPQTATYTITPLSGVCTGSSFTIVVTVNPKPVVANQSLTVCNSTAFTPTLTNGVSGNIIPSGTTYSWAAPSLPGGLTGGSPGSGSFVTGTLTNSTTGSLSAIYTVTPTAGSCTGSSFTVTAAVQPTPVLSSATTLSDICSGSTLTYTATSASAVSFNWTRAAVSGINLNAPASGSGATISETLTSTNFTNTVVAYAITMTINGCTNTQNVTVTVKPTPDVILNPIVGFDPYNQTICSGSTISNISFSSNVAATTYNWSRENITGITGSGSLSAFSGTGSVTGGFNSGNSTPTSVNFSVQPVANGCTGATINNIAVVTINPVPTLTISSPSTQTVCSGNTTTAISFSGVATSFGWSHNQTGSIGIAANGAGNISSFTASNSGTSPVDAVFTVAPVYNNVLSCSGTAQNFTITINPRPVLTSTLTPPVICSGNTFTYNPTTNATGVTTVFNWTRATVAGISNAAASGAGNPNEVLINTTGSPVVVTYVYSLSATNNSISCSSSTTYNVQVTVNPAPGISANPSASQSFCTGSSTNAITLASTNGVVGTSIAWARTNTANITGTSSGSGSIPSIALTNITTSVQTTDFTGTATTPAGCTSTTTISVQVNPPIINNYVDKSQATETELCGQPKNIVINSPPPTGGDGNYTYQWYYSSPGSSNFLPIAGGTSAVLTYNISDNAFFYRVVTSGGCSNTSETISLNKPTNAGSAVITGGGTYCLGGSGVSINLAGSVVGATYKLQIQNGASWDNVASPGGLAGTGFPLTFNNVIPSTTTPGTYVYRIVGEVTLKNGSLCVQAMTGTVSVIVNALPSNPTGVNGSPLTLCAGQSTNIFGTTTGSPVNINWYSTSSGGTALNGSTVASGSNYSVSPLSTTTYYAESINTSTGCVSAARVPVTITVNPRPVITSSNIASVCSGGSLALALTNDLSIVGSTYAWVATDNVNTSGESLSTQNTATINNTLINATASAQTVNYSVSVTTPAGCTSLVQSLVVTVNPTPAVTLPQTQTICSATAFGITPANGGGNIVPASTNYTWLAPSGTGFTGGSAQAVPQSSIGQTLTNTTNTQTTATYQVTPVSGSCTGSVFTVTVPINPRPSVPTTQTWAVCSGSTFSFVPSDGVSGNLVPAGTTYSWSAPTGSGINGVASGSNLAAVTGSLTNTSSAPQTAKVASYSVTATSGSCSSSFPLDVTVNPLPVATISGTTSICQNGAAPNITFTGTTGTSPFTFIYSINGAGSNTIATVSGNSVTLPVATSGSGNFTYGLISVTDNAAGGCTQVQSGSATVQINPQPTLSAASTTAVCSGSNAVISLSGMLPGTTASVSYTLAGVAQTPVTVSSNGSGIGTFNIPVVDADNGKSLVITSINQNATGCAKAFATTTTIMVNPRLQATISGSDLACPGNSTPLTITVTGSGPFAGTLSNGTAFSGTAPTTISVSVTPITTTTYTIATLTNTSSGCSSIAGDLSGSASLTIPSGNAGEWTGAKSTDWFDCRNWANGQVPGSSTNVTIPATAVRTAVIDPSTSYAGVYGGIATANNITISGQSLSFTGAGTLNVSGNWQNSVGTSGFAAGIGTVAFVGSTLQTITTTAASENFYNLTVDKPGAANTASTGLTLGSTTQVGGTLNLSGNGIINSTSSNMLNITNCDVAAVNGGSVNTYVNGPINRCTNSTGDYAFPVGNPNGPFADYRPVIVAPQSSSTSNFTAEYKLTAPADPLSLRFMTGILQTEHWQIDRTSGAVDAVVKLQYINPAINSAWFDILPPCSNCNVAIAKSFNVSPGSNPWYFTNFQNFNLGFNSSLPEYRSWLDAGLIWSKPLSSFGLFTFGFDYNQVLPIKLLSFNGTLEGGAAKLTWQIESNRDLAYFDVEYSKDGQHFEKVGKVEGSSALAYSFRHLQLAAGPNYYRLRMNEKTGATTTSQVVLLTVDNIPVTIIKGLQRNPVTTSAIVSIISASNQAARWKIVDQQGKVAGAGQVALYQGHNNTNINIGLVPQGFYFLQVVTNDGVQATLKLLKQ